MYHIGLDSVSFYVDYVASWVFFWSLSNRVHALALKHLCPNFLFTLCCDNWNISTLIILLMWLFVSTCNMLTESKIKLDF